MTSLPLPEWPVFDSPMLIVVECLLAIYVNFVCFVLQFLSRNGIECSDLEELFIKDQSLTNESEHFLVVLAFYPWNSVC